MPVLAVPRVFGGTLLLTIAPSQASISITAIGSDGRFTAIGSDGQFSGVGSDGQMSGIGQSGTFTAIGFDGQLSNKD